jgi:hypothetical protein
MNNWRWDNCWAFRDQDDSSNLETTTSGKFVSIGNRFCWYGSDDCRARIDPPSCRQYKTGDFRTVRRLNWDEIIDEDEDDENWADRRVPSGGISCPGHGNDNDNSKSEEDTQSGGKGNRKRMGAKNGKGKLKSTENGKGNGKATEKGMGMGTGTGWGNRMVSLNKHQGQTARRAVERLQGAR